MNKFLLILLLLHSPFIFAEEKAEVPKANSEENSGEAAQQEITDKKQIIEVPVLPDTIIKETFRDDNPLSPGQTREIRKLIREDRKARNEEVIPVDPVISDTAINLTRKNKPIKLSLRQGYATILVFRDVAGAPYKVTPLDFGDNKAYTKKLTEENMITLFATKEFTTTNFSVIPEGADHPIIFHLSNGDRKVDYQRNIIIQQFSPGSLKKIAKDSDLATPVPVVNDASLMRFLNDDPPPEAQIVPVMSEHVSAWWFNDKLIVRTKFDLLSPDGTPIYGGKNWRVYEIASPLPILMFSDNGSTHEIGIALDQVQRYSHVGEQR